MNDKDEKIKTEENSEKEKNNKPEAWDDDIELIDWFPKDMYCD